MKLIKTHQKHSKKCSFAWRAEQVDSSSLIGTTGFTTHHKETIYARVSIGDHFLLLERHEVETLAKRFTEILTEPAQPARHLVRA